MSKVITLLGSTGSIGTQSLDVCRMHGYEVFGLSANSSVDKLLAQIAEFHPKYVAVTDPAAFDKLSAALAGQADAPKLLKGAEGLRALACMDGAGTVLNAVVGIAGLDASLAAIESGHDLALANKESLVTGGHLVTDAVKKHGVHLLPVDSEHSAIFQCLQDQHSAKTLEKILLTASGGPFFGMTTEQLRTKTKADALKHPNWTMGAKITIDSATLMNKGLEIIEAMRLYRLPLRQVDAVIHRQSIVHSLVEFHDGAMLAQLGTPDMKLPIRYAMTYPNRAVSPAEPLDLLKCPPLTFAEPDEEVFRCLKIAKQCAAIGNVYCAAMNGANEEAVAAFLCDEIGICAIPDLIEAALDKTETVYQPQLSDILEADRLAREVVRLCESENHFRFAYELDAPVEEKIDAVVRRVYGGAGAEILPAARRQIRELEALGFGGLPVCIAKTQASLSDDPALLGAPEGFTVTVRSVTVSAGAGFLVALTGNIMTMPGLPKSPAAERIDVDENGVITGMF